MCTMQKIKQFYVRLNSVNLEYKTKSDRLCKLQKQCTQLAAASDKVYQLLAHGR